MHDIIINRKNFEVDTLIKLQLETRLLMHSIYSLEYLWTLDVLLWQGLNVKVVIELNKLYLLDWNDDVMLL